MKISTTNYLGLSHIPPGFGLLFYFAATIAIFFPSYPIEIPSFGRFLIEPFPILARIYLFAAFLPLIGSLYLSRTSSVSIPSVSYFLQPLSALPLAYTGYSIPCAPAIVSSNLLFFVPIIVCTIAVHRMLVPQTKQSILARIQGKQIFLFFLLIIFAIGSFISFKVGECSVDEAHYLMQAESIYQDHDLNIINNLGFDHEEALAKDLARLTGDPAEKERLRPQALTSLRAHLHVSGNSPEGKWYSWHPFGLPILMAPFCALGMVGRHFLLALISASGLLLLWLLCKALGAPNKWATAAVCALGFSAYWMVYSCRALPEILGATLVIGAVYSTYRFKTHPISAVFLLIFCAGFSPWVHPRIVPAIALTGAYFLFHFFFIYSVSRRIKWGAVAVLVLIACGAAGYLYISQRLFSASSGYNIRGLFGVYPEGSWLTFFSDRGLLYGFPLAALLIILPIRSIFFEKSTRLYGLLVLTALLSYALLFGASDCWDAGPTFKGRYMLTVAPLTLPLFARWLSRCSSIERTWAIFLACWSAALFFIPLCNINAVGRDLLHDPVSAMQWKQPLYRHLIQPYFISDIMVGHPYHGLSAFTTNVFPVVLTVISTAILTPLRTYWKTLILFLVFPAVTLIFHYHTYQEPEFLSPQQIARQLAHTPLRHARVYSCSGSPISVLQHNIDRFDVFRPTSLSLADLGVRQTPDNIYSRDRLEINGWENKDYRWLTLTAPFRDGFAGPRVLSIRGRIEGNAQPFIAVREGARTVLYEPIATETSGLFALTFTFPLMRNFQNIYILMRAEGHEGLVTITDLDWKPALTNRQSSEQD